MAKRGGFPRGGGMPNINNLMKQAQKMQQNMAKLQEELAEQLVEATVGGGAVTVTATCKKEVKEIKIKPEVVDPEEIEMLEDLIMAAVNEVMRKADEVMSEAMEKATGGLGGSIPGLF